MLSEGLRDSEFLQRSATSAVSDSRSEPNEDDSEEQVSSPGLLALYLHFFVSALKSVERVKGIEPSCLFRGRNLAQDTLAQCLALWFWASESKSPSSTFSAPAV